MKKMIIVFTGSRKLSKIEVYNILGKFKFKKLIVGDCSEGGDLYAQSYAHHNKIPIEEFKADWSTFGDRAGPIRNETMVNYAAKFRDIYGIAIKKGISKGTSDCINNFLKHNISYKLYVIDIKKTEDNYIV